MPRGSLSHKDAMGQGGFFKEGIVLVDKSVVAVHQFPPPKDNPKAESVPFTAVRWSVTKLDKDLNVIELADGEEPVVLVFRLGKIDMVRPGQLKEKDFDDLDVLPKDLGDEVDTEGNAVHLEPDARIEGSGWAKLEESLVKSGFKEAVAKRGIATDYVGLVVHLKQGEPEKYTAKTGRYAGQERTSTPTIADRIYKFPYDKSSKVKVGGATAEAGEGAGKGKANGAAAAEVDEKLVAVAATALEKASAKFKTEFYTGKPVERKKFQTGLVKEMMKQQVEEKLQDPIMAMVKTDDGLKALAAEVGFKVAEDTVTFAAED